MSNKIIELMKSDLGKYNYSNWAKINYDSQKRFKEFEDVLVNR